MANDLGYSIYIFEMNDGSEIYITADNILKSLNGFVEEDENYEDIINEMKKYEKFLAKLNKTYDTSEILVFSEVIDDMISSIEGDVTTLFNSILLTNKIMTIALVYLYKEGKDISDILTSMNGENTCNRKSILISEIVGTINVVQDDKGAATFDIMEVLDTFVNSLATSSMPTDSEIVSDYVTNLGPLMWGINPSYRSSQGYLYTHTAASSIFKSEGRGLTTISLNEYTFLYWYFNNVLGYQNITSEMNNGGTKLSSVETLNSTNKAKVCIPLTTSNAEYIKTFVQKLDTLSLANKKRIIGMNGNYYELYFYGYIRALTHYLYNGSFPTIQHTYYANSGSGDTEYIHGNTIYFASISNEIYYSSTLYALMVSFMNGNTSTSSLAYTLLSMMKSSVELNYSTSGGATLSVDTWGNIKTAYYNMRDKFTISGYNPTAITSGYHDSICVITNKVVTNSITSASLTDAEKVAKYMIETFLKDIFFSSSTDTYSNIISNISNIDYSEIEFTSQDSAVAASNVYSNMKALIDTNLPTEYSTLFGRSSTVLAESLRYDDLALQALNLNIAKLYMCVNGASFPGKAGDIN